MKQIYNQLHIKLLLLLTVLFTGGLTANAFNLSTYAESSVLASGKWVKVSVPESGVYLITTADLKKWGFNDISKVRIHGYGGKILSDLLSQSNYIDDLPLIQHETTSRGIVFYGVGPEVWSDSSNSGYTSSLSNYYDTAGYYFITESDETAREIELSGRAGATDPNTTFTCYLQHEQDLVSPGETGWLLVGEDFKYTPSRQFKFSLPDRVEDTDVRAEVSFLAKTYTTSSLIAISANGTALTTNSTDNISETANDSHCHGAITSARHTFSMSGTDLTLSVAHSSSVTVQSAWLNYIAINYTRQLKLNTSGYLTFSLRTTGAKLSNAGETTRVWDVTEPRSIIRLNTQADGTSASWTNDYTGVRQYVAWNENASLPSPTFEENVINQNLHGLSTANMVIFTYPEWKSQAERIATLHRDNDSLSVQVVNITDVYNEFGSGCADVGAIRRFLKMMYDRGNASGDVLKYALIMGRTTYDNRHLTSGVQALKHKTIPCWIGGSITSCLYDNDSYCSDDPIAMLEDNSGQSKGIDNISIALGRMPVRSLSEAKSDVDKLESYIKSSTKGNWKNHILALADNGDLTTFYNSDKTTYSTGVHFKQTEDFCANILSDPKQTFIIDKIYLDAYKMTGNNMPEARSRMYRLLDEGIVWWNFVGHANTTSWTADGQFTYDDLNNLYLRQYPMLYAATCDFLRYDSNTTSGGEIIFHNRYGGVIAAISATRPVYITENGFLTNAISKQLATRNADGRLGTIGEIYQNAKNNILNSVGQHTSNTNRLQYVLMGDPALRLTTPSNHIELQTINGATLDDEDNPAIVKSLSSTAFAGRIVDTEGKTMENFNGVVSATIYDAEKSTTTTGEATDNVRTTFEEMGDKLYTGSAQVKNGIFTLNATLPAETAENFREATISFYAYSTENSDEAVGVNRQFYIYGIDETAPTDTIAPTIESMVLNHSNFKEGDKVNTEPMLIAQVSDNVGINLSTSGIGHQMTLLLDGKTSYNDVSLYYTPSTDGSASGTINYPLEELTAGEHTLRLRVWDVANNSASQTIQFTVANDVAPTIYDVYTDANPASTTANFYISHDRPDAMCTVTVSVYNLLGHLLWQSSATGLSDMFTSIPVTWDLCDTAGRRVNRGIYIYRASITTDGTTYTTKSKKLAVTAQ